LNHQEVNFSFSSENSAFTAFTTLDRIWNWITKKKTSLSHLKTRPSQPSTITTRVKHLKIESPRSDNRKKIKVVCTSLWPSQPFKITKLLSQTQVIFSLEFELPHSQN
jgi:hypothetical protein